MKKLKRVTNLVIIAIVSAWILLVVPRVKAHIEHERLKKEIVQARKVEKANQEQNNVWEENL